MRGKKSIHITESPRDAQQGLPFVILPAKRAQYINALLKVGFDVIDFGSFVSTRAIPQMADQQKVLEDVDKSGSETRLMAVVGNLRGGIDAADQNKLDIIGFPFSISATFLKKNINSDPLQALSIIDGLLEICNDRGKELRIFMSMAFGNPYGDVYNKEILSETIGKLNAKGILEITLADTIGCSSPSQISETLEFLQAGFPRMQFGLHIHTRPHDAAAKLAAAWQAGCRSFDGVLNGIGGCPMTGYEMIGNINTFELLAFCRKNHISHALDKKALQQASEVADAIFRILPDPV